MSAVHALAVLLLITAGLTLAPAPASAVTIELKDAAPDRIERQRKAARGETLEGTPAVDNTAPRLKKLGLEPGAPIMLRIFKETSQLELWMQKGRRFVKFATYPICHWSGSLGPKMAEGDKQSPEGFYTITRRQLHWGGRWPRSLNIGFPNALDRSLLRTGSYILIHGGCTSIGCYAMTNPVMEEVFGLVRNALSAGQQHVPVHVFPFKMTRKKLAQYKKSEWIGFWRSLKAGYDSFERTRRPPRINVCNGKYQITDAAPTEVGRDMVPLEVCEKTAEILQAEDELQSIVSHPSRLAKLSTAEKRLVGLLSTSPRKILKRRNAALARASSFVSVGKRGKGNYKRTSRRITVKCNLKRPSCRKHLALKRKRAAMKLKSKRRKSKRRRVRSANSRRYR
ncbi:MAG: murein L,D-transpeptidase [Alphaproteobacteria bacterium]|nr:murein L,D-transpeptidase [Alphaproteobacteria bacterium]